MGNSENDSGGAKPPNLNSRFRDLEDQVTNLTIFVDSWTAACKLPDEERGTAMKALSEMWESLGA